MLKCEVRDCNYTASVGDQYAHEHLAMERHHWAHVIEEMRLFREVMQPPRYIIDDAARLESYMRRLSSKPMPFSAQEAPDALPSGETANDTARPANSEPRPPVRPRPRE